MLKGAFQLVKEMLALWFQPTCLLCGSLTGIQPFCERCLVFLPVEGPHCECCGRSLSHTTVECGECREWLASPLDQLRTSFWLTEKGKLFLHKAKYGGYYELFSMITEHGLSSSPYPKTPVLVPVPLHWSKYSSRTFNQSEVLASILSKEWNLPICASRLEKTKITSSQTVLNKTKRAQNLKGAFAWRSRKSPPKYVCLVDDTYTTGATLGQCARALKKAGSEVVVGWTLFRTPG